MYVSNIMVHYCVFYVVSQDEFQQYGIDWDGPVPAEDDMDVDAVQVPETTCPLSQEHLDELVATIDPLRESNSYGIDIYLETMEFVNTHIA
jgi:hypothetical protein